MMGAMANAAQPRPGPSLGVQRARHIRVLLSVVWLAYLSYPIAGLLGEHPSALRVGLDMGGLAIFVVTYLGGTLEPHRLVAATPGGWGMPVAAWSRSTAIRITILSALAVALTLGNGGAWTGLFVYETGVVGMRSDTRVGLVRIAMVVALAGGCSLLTPGFSLASFLGYVLTPLAIGVVSLGIRRLLTVNAALHETRAELARHAVAEERLRFSRDLHDLLGHSLSMVALKLELVRRLMDQDLSRARSELADADCAVRQALDEVRQAVSGYRRACLASELAGARLAFVTAGITLSEEHTLPPDSLPEELDTVLAWAVREATTNVLRHADALHCHMATGIDADMALLEVSDDGAGRSSPVDDSPPPRAAGHGLVGLRERVERVGGHLHAGQRSGGGFTVRVELPLRSVSKQIAPPEKVERFFDAGAAAPVESAHIESPLGSS